MPCKAGSAAASPTTNPPITTQQWLGQVQSTFNELTDNDLSTQLSTFFNSWSNLANKPQDIGPAAGRDPERPERRRLLPESARPADQPAERCERSAARRWPSDANALAQQVADLNGQITVAEGGTGGTANGLRDQRDAVLKQLSQLIDIKTIPKTTAAWSTSTSAPSRWSSRTTNRGVGDQDRRRQRQDRRSTVVFKADNGDDERHRRPARRAERRFSSRSPTRSTKVDRWPDNLIFELNKIHASGQGLQGFSTVTSTNAVDDPTVALNDPPAGLKFTPTNGSFVVHVTNKTTGLETSTLVQVDLDGQNGNDTTLNSLAADLNGDHRRHRDRSTAAS